MGVLAVYPGTFDPLTYGHIDVAKRASKMFDKVLLAVAVNYSKTPFFSLEERIELAKVALDGIPNLEVCSFDGLLVECTRQVKAEVIVRGLRAVSDFEYEVQLAGLNRQMAPEIETVFISAAQQYAFLSSSMVREIAKLGGDVTEFVHPVVSEALASRLA